MPTRSMKWNAFPHDAKSFDYGGPKLKKHWDRLHRGDREPFPDEASLGALVDEHPALAPKGGLKAAAKTLQEAWRHYHIGDFGGAVQHGLSVGPLGYDVANKAANIYATYLEHDKERKAPVLLDAVHRAEELQASAPSVPNAWYLYAQALGRYSQSLSVAKALADGVGSKIKSSLERALELEPEHADANIALGLYHALVIHKIGSTFGAITYGASKDAALEHFRAALRLNPESAIARIEYANGLIMMFGKSKAQEAVRLYEEAAASEPLDAMEKLDVELAKSELQD